MVERSSIADYLPDFARLGRETAFAEPSGYRVVRSSYRDIADAAYRFARELTARKIRKGDRVVLWAPELRRLGRSVFRMRPSRRDRCPHGSRRLA